MGPTGQPQFAQFGPTATPQSEALVTPELQIVKADQTKWAKYVKIFSSLLIILGAVDLTFKVVGMVGGHHQHMLRIFGSLMVIVTGVIGAQAAEKKTLRLTRSYYRRTTVVAVIFLALTAYVLISADVRMVSKVGSRSHHKNQSGQSKEMDIPDTESPETGEFESQELFYANQVQQKGWDVIEWDDQDDWDDNDDWDDEDNDDWDDGDDDDWDDGDEVDDWDDGDDDDWDDEDDSVIESKLGSHHRKHSKRHGKHSKSRKHHSKHKGKHGKSKHHKGDDSKDGKSKNEGKAKHVKKSSKKGTTSQDAFLFILGSIGVFLLLSLACLGGVTCAYQLFQTTHQIHLLRSGQQVQPPQVYVVPAQPEDYPYVPPYIAPQPSAIPPPPPQAPVEVHVHQSPPIYPEIQPVQEYGYLPPLAPMAPQLPQVGSNFQPMSIYDPRARQS